MSHLDEPQVRGHYTSHVERHAQTIISTLILVSVVWGATEIVDAGKAQVRISTQLESVEKNVAEIRAVMRNSFPMDRAVAEFGEINRKIRDIELRMLDLEREHALVGVNRREESPSVRPH